MVIAFGREICCNLDSAESREWLVTNGIGGYASGTIANLLTRRYHGLLVAALKPPLARTLMLAKLDETAVYADRAYPLYTNRWADSTIEPHGYNCIESFHLEGTTPVWRYALADAILEKRIWMQQGANTTYIQYRSRRASQPIAIAVKALVNYRDYHHMTSAGDWKINLETLKNGVCVTAFPGATPLYLLTDATSEAKFRVSTLLYNWYYGFDLEAEKRRGLEYCEDHLHAATFHFAIAPGSSLTLIASTDKNPELNGGKALEVRRTYEEELLQNWSKAIASPDWINHLVLAADQFIVNRPLPEEPEGKTIIAGYPWFSDWGRDTTIALPGLTICTGRWEIARSILRTFARYVDRGMLPNRFPDAGGAPEYNTADATLWYFEAVRAYCDCTGDEELLTELWPTLCEIVDWHVRGTRYNIRVDPDDGLLYAGESGVQLTWMDAKIGGWVVTPRIGKPIELSALWYNAVQAMASFARRLGKSHNQYQQLGDRTCAGFDRFWNHSTSYCYDVLDGPDGNDISLRPNQIFAVSLPLNSIPPRSANSLSAGTRQETRYTPLLTPVQRRAVVDACAQGLLTSHGLRSLSPQHPQYRGTYGGDQLQRDSAYHQGTVWGWPIGAFVLAHLHVYKDPAQAREFLEPMSHHITAGGVGSLGEIFEGDAPHSPRGCTAQAWTVAEVLRAWLAINNVGV
ncbi:MAG: glycogen debranching enzyme family protein [Microcoleus sp. PH2017_10_PVI_O_A]|uniref:amylo-alpha-1,6-glucosidase n=1 Tax=unclassified Microcoleus TaxID=2642155 RepID=UPI001DFCB4A5|nr:MULTISPECIES: amylo-alpha-1,6-glucosidase [unclassified Microcoleus]TAE85056.1 MAG: glycogen debranching protein [Oscillatoriales cyanobacterium]MCC3404801.1 glycogen debranching enzyme family protein [Microcoleus sp. PH2017_10_PVI_O_A]MCC3458908.1 glycogen debranching enzyme family protein [Microcoleus sp. PH2017_11_PCY_U_A]MCC3477109.1 glycogen debranching enzyme family protein [Microcoleus sp. PH2017_12_PCY_D_A]MCC3526723.1 glycogen debranching enzyme family protein [Microcoleus sp. PH20